LSPCDPPSITIGAMEGPRHFEFHPSGRWVYLVTELGGSVFLFDFDAATGAWTPTQKVSALPAGYSGRKWSADLHVAPSGKFLYASNRAHESVVVFAIDADTGMLTLVEHVAVHGKTPRNFCLAAEGKFLYVANQGSNDLVTFAVDAKTGKLTKLKQQAEIGATPSFTCVVDSP